MPQTLKHLFLNLLIPLVVCGCGAPPEDPNQFEYSLVGTTFKVIKLKGQEDNYFKPQGTKTFLIETQTLTIEHQNYLERQGYPCYGVVKYDFLQYDYDSFLKELNRRGILDSDEEESSTGYDIFTPYDDPTANDFGQDSGSVEAIEVQKVYFIGDLSESTINAGCTDSYEKEHYFHVNFYKNGDMEYFDYNRKLIFFNRPI